MITHYVDTDNSRHICVVSPTNSIHYHIYMYYLKQTNNSITSVAMTIMALKVLRFTIEFCCYSVNLSSFMIHHRIYNRCTRRMAKCLQVKYAIDIYKTKSFSCYKHVKCHEILLVYLTTPPKPMSGF
jgi:hypothetical protein